MPFYISLTVFPINIICYGFGYLASLAFVPVHKNKHWFQDEVRTNLGLLVNCKTGIGGYKGSAAHFCSNVSIRNNLLPWLTALTWPSKLSSWGILWKTVVLSMKQWLNSSQITYDLHKWVSALTQSALDLVTSTWKMHSQAWHSAFAAAKYTPCERSAGWWGGQWKHFQHC